MNIKINIMRLLQSTILISMFVFITACTTVKNNNILKNTYCNPVNIEYNFWRAKQNRDDLTQISYREAADPTIIIFKNEYYLFASHSNGFWVSDNLQDWKLHTTKTLENINGYAPTLMVLGDSLYYTANGNRKMYVTADPKADDWKFVNQFPEFSDPCLFADDDGKVYMYHGLTKGGPIQVDELDPKNRFNKKPETHKDLFYADAVKNGCDAPNGITENKMAYEGAWMTKHNGKYYLEYAVPGTSSPMYNDACYVSDSPTGPFNFCKNNPISMKPTGFVVGAGHGCTFKDLNGNYWHITTCVISELHRFERRIALYPTWFDKDGFMHTDTYLADYPQISPHNRTKEMETTFAGAMLLSYQKPAEASSQLKGFNPENACDENVKTWWSAETANVDEWLMIDLEKPKDIAALQINFAEQNFDTINMRNPEFAFSYIAECSKSKDGPWENIIDKTSNPKDLPHEYVPLDKLVNTQFIKITNKGKIPANGKFAIRDLRVFGFSKEPHSDEVANIVVKRDKTDPRIAVIKWDKAKNANGYSIRFGIAPDKLYNHYQILNEDVNEYRITTLTVGVDYYYAIDSYNDNGITKGNNIISD